MELEKKELNIDFGLNVLFNGEKYKLVMAHSDKVYPVGSLICEYIRLVPTDIKNLIFQCDGLNEKASVENFTKVFMQLHEKLYELFPPVIGTMVALELMNTAEDWFRALRENRINGFIDLLNGFHNNVKDIVFENSNIFEFGDDTVLQLLLTCYFVFAEKYVSTKILFNRVMEFEEKNEKNMNGIEALLKLYGECLDMQHIDYRIILTENGFESLYTFKSSISLLLFEIANIVNKSVSILRCKNCGNFFVPERRSDTLYCSYELKNEKGKTCKDVGAQNTRAEKEKNDLATKEYRKLYMRYKMMLLRHPEDEDASDAFQHMTQEIRKMRNKLAHEEIDVKDFMKWLDQYK